MIFPILISKGAIIISNNTLDLSWIWINFSLRFLSLFNVKDRYAGEGGNKVAYHYTFTGWTCVDFTPKLKKNSVYREKKGISHEVYICNFVQ